MADKVRSEDVLGQKWDHCMADTLIKTGTQCLDGAMLYVYLFGKVSKAYVNCR